MKVVCEQCSKEVERPSGEVARSLRLGRHTYCSLLCSTKATNGQRKKPTEQRLCPICGVVFKTTTRKGGKTFCSRSCASRGSVTEGRRSKAVESGHRNAGNLISPAEALKKREGPRYQKVEALLGQRPHEFEYELGGFVFDLALFDCATLVEFDGPYHRYVTSQAAIDEQKNQVAHESGYRIVRIPTTSADIIELTEQLPMPVTQMVSLQS